MPRRPSSIAAERPAGPPPMMRTATRSSSGARRGGKDEAEGSAAGRTGRPSTGSTRRPGRTSSMQDLTGTPSARTRHWEHWPLAQKIPCGAPSLAWWPKMRIAVGEERGGDRLALEGGRRAAAPGERDLGARGEGQNGVSVDAVHGGSISLTCRQRGLRAAFSLCDADRKETHYSTRPGPGPRTSAPCQSGPPLLRWRRRSRPSAPAEGGLMRILILALSLLVLTAVAPAPAAERTEKPALHGRNWMAITGKPLAATAGAMIFMKGGNAVDAACAMLGAVCTMHDVLTWGGETQALIFNPKTGKVLGLNALGVAPTGATAAFYKSKGYEYPPADGALAAVTPGTPGGLLTMLAEFGTMSLADVLEPSLHMAEGYPIEKELCDMIERAKAKIKQWPASARGLPAPCGRGDRGTAAGRGLPPAGPPADAPAAGRGRAQGPGRGQGQEGGDLRGLRPLLPGRHRPGPRPRLGRGRRPHDPRRPRPAGRSTSRRPSRRTTRASRSTS